MKSFIVCFLLLISFTLLPHNAENDKMRHDDNFTKIHVETNDVKKDRVSQAKRNKKIRELQEIIKARPENLEKAEYYRQLAELYWEQAISSEDSPEKAHIYYNKAVEIYNIIINNYPAFQKLDAVYFFKADIPTAKNIALTVMIVACAIAVFLACYYQIYTIFPPLGILRGGLKQVAAGNYSYRLKSDKNDEIGAVIGEFEMMRRKLADLDKQKSAFDRQRGEIIAGISHDLKTPLTTIQGYTKGLMDGVANTPEKTARYLKTIYETALTMNSLVNQLNDFSKMDIDTIEYSFMERDLVKLIQDFAAINIPIYATKGLKVVTDFADEPVEADIDKDQFLRVVRNILDNSVKYKDKKEGVAKIKVYSDGSNAVLEIGDNGPGVSPHEIEYIFESYYRGDPSRTNPTTGSGLGLSIVKTIITAHEGTVEAVNDGGLKIIIKIPQRRKRN